MQAVSTTESTEATEAGRKGFRIRIRTLPSARGEPAGSAGGAPSREGLGTLLGFP
jgi:hypothetical protein